MIPISPKNHYKENVMKGGHGFEWGVAGPMRCYKVNNSNNWSKKGIGGQISRIQKQDLQQILVSLKLLCINKKNHKPLRNAKKIGIEHGKKNQFWY